MRKDIFEILYEMRYIRPVFKSYLKAKEFVGGKVQNKIENNISVKRESRVNIRNAGAQPYAEFAIEIDNKNFSPLQIDGFNIVFSLGKRDSYFKNISWSREVISSPPPNISIDDIDSKGDGIMKIETMLPSYRHCLVKERAGRRASDSCYSQTCSKRR